MLRLSTVTYDLGKAADKGDLEPAYGMDKQVLEVLRQLSRKNRKSVHIVGHHGVGKTRLVHGITLAGMDRREGSALPECHVLELNMGALLSATRNVEETAHSLIKFLKANTEIILFIDGLYSLLTMEEELNKGVDLLKAAIIRGEIVSIGTLTPGELDRFSVEAPDALQNSVPVRLEPAGEGTTLGILERLRPALEAHHGVEIGEDALEDVVKMSLGYMPDRYLPGNAVDILDQACARYKLKAGSKDGYPDMVDSVSMRHLGSKVGSHDVKRVVMENTAIDIDADQGREWKQKLDERLMHYVIGQDAAVDRITSTMAEIRMNFGRSGRPGGVLLLGGPRGVGKVHTVRSMQYQLMGSDDDLTVFKMGDYTDAEAVSGLFGVDSEQRGNAAAGKLAAARNAPLATVVFEGIETALDSFFEAFLPILMTGCIKDAGGRKVDCRNVLFMLTLNTPALEPGNSCAPEDLIAALPGGISKEVAKRFDAVVPFSTLGQDDVRLIIRRGLKEFYGVLKPRGIGLRVRDEAYEVLVEKGYTTQKGADELPDVLERLVVRPAYDLIESGGAPAGATITVAAENGEVVLEVDQ